MRSLEIEHGADAAAELLPGPDPDAELELTDVDEATELGVDRTVTEGLVDGGVLWCAVGLPLPPAASTQTVIASSATAATRSARRRQ